MSKTKGYAAPTSKAPLAPGSFLMPEPRAHDVVIDIKYCGICHSDIHQTRNEWGDYLEESIFPMVPGHEIAGVVSAVGSKVKSKTGRQSRCRMFRRFGVAPVRNASETWNSIVPCTRLSPQQPRQDGNQHYGGYSESVVVDENYVLRMPDNLPLDACAPLLCAGITLYSPLKHWQADRGKKSHRRNGRTRPHGCQTCPRARRRGHRFSEPVAKKKDDGKRLGADHFYATSDPETFTKLKRYFDLIINTVSAEMD